VLIAAALAEAEVEYEERTDSVIDVAFPIDSADRAKLAAAFGLAALPDGAAMAVIWTTTPWTIPSNQALNVNPDLTYALVATPRGHLVLAQDLVAACLASNSMAASSLPPRAQHSSGSASATRSTTARRPSTSAPM
jgi:isoleucyl-tRNA synthetase